MGSQTFAERMHTNERLDLCHELRVRRSFEVRGDPIFERPEAKVVEAVDLGLRERLQLHVGQRRAAPECESVAQEQRPVRRLSRVARAPDEVLEACEIELVTVDFEQIPGRPSVQEPRPSSLRSCETVFWSEVVAVRGGCSPQSWSTRRSAETASLACSSSNVNNARWFRPASGTGEPPSRTSRGPRTLNSNIPWFVTGFTMI